MSAPQAILVVDDVAENRDLLIRRLQRLGFTAIDQAVTRAAAAEDMAKTARDAASNAVNLGTPQLRIVHGAAPAALDGLEAPDAVLIGGGLGDEAVFSAAWAALKPGSVNSPSAVNSPGQCCANSPEARMPRPNSPASF